MHQRPVLDVQCCRPQSYANPEFLPYEPRIDLLVAKRTGGSSPYCPERQWPPCPSKPLGGRPPREAGEVSLPSSGSLRQFGHMGSAGCALSPPRPEPRSAAKRGRVDPPCKKVQALPLAYRHRDAYAPGSSPICAARGQMYRGFGLSESPTD